MAVVPDEKALRSYRRDVVDVFDSHYDKLCSVLKESMESFANKAFAAKFITDEVKNEKKFSSIMSQFKATLECRNSDLEIQEDWKRYIEILEDVGGPAAIAGKDLATKLPIAFSDLLSQYGLQYEDLDKECDDDELIIKASRSIDDFRKAGCFLTLSSQSLNEISQINDDVERKTAVLWKWKGKNGSAATTIELVKAFLKMEKRDTAESLLKYLSEKPTESIDSQPDYLAPYKAKDRYPNWEHLTPSEKERVTNKLMIENRNVRKAYAVFVCHIMQSFIKRKVDPNVVQSIAHSFGTLESSMYISTIVFGFHENDSIAIVLSKLTKHCSWFNYESLKVIVEAVGNETEKQYLETYEDKNLIPYLNRSIYEIPCASSHDQSRTNLLFKVSKDLSMTGNEVKAVQLNLAELLGCTHAILHFHNYNEGCIELVFSLPTTVFCESSYIPPMLTHIEWEESQKCYKVKSNVDLISLLPFSEKPELSKSVMKKDIACQMLQKHSDRISSPALPVEIVQMLYTERVISKETLDEVNRLGGILGDGPLRALHTTVYEDPSKLKVLASILLKSKQMVPVANDILKEYEQTFPSKFILHRTYQYNFDQMKVTFGNLIVIITPLIKAVIPSLDDLKIYLRRCFQELRPQLSIAKSFDDVMDLVQDKCTIINICCLEAVVNHYNITEAKSHIKEFKKAVDTFSETVKVSICLKKSFKLISRSHHLICETIEFILEWEVDEYTLKHIKDMLSKAFEDMAESVQVRTIKEGRSIIVACYAPCNMMNILLVTAKENLGLLKEMGLLKLTIGYDIIYDKCQRDKEVRPIVKENTKELRSQLELRQTISKKMTLQISSIVQQSEERKQKKEKVIKDLTSHLKWKEVIKEELLSVSAEKQKELETVQEVITSLMLRLRERNKQFEALRQNLKDHPAIDDSDNDIIVSEPEITVTTLIEGNFEFPTKTKLVSAVHNISVSKPLTEPQRLEIQHCVKLETQAHSNCLHFVRAPSSLTTLPHQFTLIEGGQFSLGSRHGVIDITFESSCLVAIVADHEVNEESHEMNEGVIPLLSFVYTGVIYYEEKDDEWIATFSVMKDLESHLEFVKQSSDTEDPIYFDFINENGFVELIFQQELPSGWSIKPIIEPCKLWQTDIDKFGSSPISQLSSCQFLIHADDTLDILEDLVYSVELKGIIPSTKITLHQKRSGSLKSPAQIIDHQYYNEAIRRSGKVEARVSKVLVQGPARVGKTSVKCLLLSQRYNKQSSTGVAERPQVAVSMETYGKNKEKKWELVSDKNIVEMFSNDIRTLIKEKDQSTSKAQPDEHENSKKEGDSGANKSHKEMEHNQQDVHKDVSEKHLDLGYNPLNNKVNQDSNSSTTHIKNESNVQVAQYENYHQDHDDDVPSGSEASMKFDPSPQLPEKRGDGAIKQLLNLLNKASGRTDKLTLHQDWLYFIDSGGQFQFQQILQAFIPCASVLMLVIDLAQDFSSQSSVELQCEDGMKYLVSDHSLPVDTLLRRLISMVTLSNYKQQNNMINVDSSAIKPPEKLKVIAIATHGDKCKVGQVAEAIAHKEGQLEQIFQSSSNNLIYQNPGSKKILFNIDGRKAYDPEETFDDELSNVISSIHNELSKQAFEIEVPLTWYAYEILLRHKASKRCGVLKHEDCMSLGIELGLKESEIEAALSFFFLLNSILCYPKEVTNLIFIDPHSLIEVVNELMVFVCKVRNDIDIGPGTLAGPDMANFGIISSDVFSHTGHFNMFYKISKEVNDFKSQLFDIFDYLLLAKRLPDSKYFMPALLPLINPLEAIPFESSSNIPLLFYFTNGVPVGLFCAMIVKLLSTKVTDDDNDELFNDFLWSLDTKSTCKMYSNCVILRKGDFLGRVGLIESSDWFEIHCEHHADQPKVKEAIEIAIAETKKIRGIEVKLKIAFFCPCGKQPSHRAFLKQHSSELFCELTDSPYGICIQVTKDSSHFSWNFLKSNSGKRPELNCLFELLVPISSKWDLIGRELGVDIDVSDDLNKSDDEKLNEVIQKWVKTKPTPTTWDNIIEVVKRPILQCQDLADTIKKHLDHILIEEKPSTIKSCLLDPKQDVHKLRELLAGIKNLWHEIGLALGVPNAKLEGLRQEHVDNIIRLSKVLDCWINQNAEVTWYSIITAVRSEIVGQTQVSQKIESYVLKDKLPSQTYQVSQKYLHNPLSVPLSKNEPGGLETDGPLRAPSNTQLDDLLKTKKYSQEQQESNVRENAKESSAVDSTEVYITNNLSMEYQQHSTDELSSEHKADTLPSNTTQQDTIDPSEIFQEHFADICEAIQVKPMFTINQLYSDKLVSLNFKEEVKSMSGDDYDKADKVVTELQRQVDEKGIEFLKAICDFLLKQNQELKDISTRMKSQLESLAPPT